ncbi:hypothetical protein HK096_005263 [Nowakowskiella sp. JEL0078]|nr:hypothetical protein HK096_005263 [Nowakowskiella sp. JEL0078]
MKVSAAVIVSALSASVLASSGPNVNLLSLPYKICEQAEGKSCSSRSTGAILDGSSINYAGNGVSAISGGVQLSGAVGNNRFYITTPDGKSHEQFKLKNRVLSIDVDISRVACGYNAAFYFTHMPATAFPGSGYCDAQNTCTEMDIVEANIAALQETSHSCDLTTGKCDPWGCGTNSKDDTSVAPGSSVINTLKPYTLKTYFYTDNGKDSGTLNKIVQAYKQGSTVYYPQGKNITDSNCQIWMGNAPYWNVTGKLNSMSDALTKGMTAAFSLWGSGGDGMNWLDGGLSVNPNCQKVVGNANNTAAANLVKFTNIVVSKF